jgi:hypothetical protein
VPVDRPTPGGSYLRAAYPSSAKARACSVRYRDDTPSCPEPRTMTMAGCGPGPEGSVRTANRSSPPKVKVRSSSAHGTEGALVVEPYCPSPQAATSNSSTRIAPTRLDKASAPPRPTEGQHTPGPGRGEPYGSGGTPVNRPSYLWRSGDTAGCWPAEASGRRRLSILVRIVPLLGSRFRGGDGLRVGGAFPAVPGRAVGEVILATADRERCRLGRMRRRLPDTLVALLDS